MGDVQVVRSLANRTRLAANVVLGLLTGEARFTLTRKCLACRIYFRDRQTWSRPGQCISCGYDLTGNTNGVCPECGMSI